MDEECECGGILEKSTTDFRGIKGIPCWRCSQCGAEFFDEEQAELLDKHITELINLQLDRSSDEANKGENDDL